MIRTFQLADLFTIANGFCGMLAIFEAMTFLSTRATRHLYLAAVLIPVALIFDVLDGRIARGRHAASALGRELDSLADVVSSASLQRRSPLLPASTHRWIERSFCSSSGVD
jgi:CDP-diacylglycerol--serine O-phosphatidyltransferase